MLPNHISDDDDDDDDVESYETNQKSAFSKQLMHCYVNSALENYVLCYCSHFLF
jgi:hypothetical protein